MILQILFLLILVGINAFFASSEIAIISLNDNKIRKMAEGGHKNAKLLQNLTKEPSRFLATIQVGITLSGLLASAFAAESFADRLTGFVKSSGFKVNDAVLKPVSLIVITVLLAYFTLVFGELVPKRIAMQKPEPIAMFSAKPLSLLLSAANPFVRFLTFSTNIIIRVFGGNPTANQEIVTEEEIRMMVDLGEEKGVIEKTEKNMIDNIFEFDDTEVSEIMTHRTNIIAIQVDSDINKVMDTVIAEKYTRIPVFAENIDNIVGILHVKDLLNFINNKPAALFNLQSIMRKPYFIPESKKTDELLKDLQKTKTHIAVVIDEYGGTAGIVTIEDLLEEIVGNIWDEYDEDEKEYEKTDDNTYVIRGSAPLDLIKKLFNEDLPADEYDTVSGFIIGQLGRIPEDGDKPVVEFNNIIFKVESVKEKRISRIKVCRT
ncbi:MAG: hemolysin family protein [Clostridia bacterium]|nr:hemolysin family protein [Clostridia bacterium]